LDAEGGELIYDNVCTDAIHHVSMRK